MILGHIAIIGAFTVALYGVASSLYGARNGSNYAITAGRRSVYLLTALLTLAFVVLEIAFLSDDFSSELVSGHSSSTTSAFYKATALWSSQEGSLLLWVWLLSLWSSAVLFFSHRRLPELTPYATAVLLLFAAFFSVLLIFLADPFTTVSPAPLEGQGLNPLLRHPSMMFHPPMLYSGYTLATVPFAFAVAALITGKLDANWIAATRRFALAAWACLGIGILLGARWSYAELGWGGYWAWDPVENAALMPWLALTAFLHSALIQEKRGMLRTWNVSLVLASGTLAVMGTFLVRSGIISSIHAFGASTLGVPFLVLIAVLIVSSVGLVVWRRSELHSKRRLDSLLSREAIFLFNNLVLIGLCFVVFWGTFFPLISEAVTGETQTVGPPWYDRYIVPLTLVLVLLAGFGPLIAWRKTTARKLWRNLAFPLGVAVVVAVVLIAVGIDDATAIAAFSIASFSIATVAQEFWRGTRARRAMTGESPPQALLSLVARNRRRYGGYVVHIGIAVLFIGVAASSAFQHVSDALLRPGQSVTVGGYRFDYVRATDRLSNERIEFGAVMRVTKNGRYITTLLPNRGYYPSLNRAGFGTIGRFFEGEATSEIGLRAGLTRDIWVAVQPDLDALKSVIDEADRKFADAGPELQGVLIGAVAERYGRKPPPANFRVIVSPLVSWVWIGGLIFACGALIAIWPARRPRGISVERDNKYREIRDAELDFRMGKLSQEDYRELDDRLRGEAIELSDDGI